MNNFLLSICIPTYNRPNELRRMLESIDSLNYEEIDIVISENCSPKQLETRAVVEDFKAKTDFTVHYYENERNVGYDKNIRALIKRSDGFFSMYFSDDDVFVPGALDQFVSFIKLHLEAGYILRSYCGIDDNNVYGEARYYSTDRTFPPGKDTYIELFDKSVFLSGFTIRTEYAKTYETDLLDGSLLYQLYQLAEVCYRYPAAYSRILISKQLPVNIHFFGDCKEEQDFYKGESMTGTNNLNFLRWYMKLIDYVAELHRDDSASIIRHNMSKYSYPLLSFEIKANGTGQSYKSYCQALKEMGLASSIYFKIYYYSLKLFGVKICDKIILFLKKIIGHRPKL